MQFNFSKLRLFDKMGHPVPLSFTGVMKITFTDDFGKRTSFLAETDSSLNITNTIKIEHSGRFTEEMFDNDNIAGVIDADSSVYDTEFTVSRSKINSAGDTVYYSIDDIDIASVKTAADSMNISLAYPGILFNANILFNEVSTELVETQNVFIGIQDSSALVSLADYFSNDNDFVSHYRLFFFIDNRTDKEFRLFTVQDDEVVWSDRYIMDLQSAGRVDIGFCSEQEGFFEDEMYVCLVDTHIKESDDDLGKVYPIGKISLKAESVGEDERYRTLFTNFGIPDPKTYSGIFRNTDLAEEKTDNILLNENSKRMFLSYTDIFPYAGTYKALINAVNILGYDDIFFKEWYKKIGTDTPEKDYITYDISYHADPNANTINNVPIEERIQLRKLNWLSMVYHINEEISDAAVDEYGFPQTENINTYNNSEILVKLMSLKNWLEKYVIGLNCRIIDVGGEGIIFERYLLNTYGTVQQQLPYDAVKNIYAYTGTELAGYDNAVLTLETKQRSSAEHNPTAQISFEIGDDSSSLMIDNLKYMRFIDFCNGYFDSNSVYHTGIPADSSVTEDTIFAGGTFQFAGPFDRYSVKAYNIADKFSFDVKGIGDVEGSNLRIENDSIYINPYQKYRKDSSVSDMVLFKDLPIIQVERGTIRAKDKTWDKSVIYKIYPNSDNDSSMNYILENVRTFERDGVQDRVTLIPGKWEDETIESGNIIIYPFNSDTSILISRTNAIRSDSSFNSDGAEHFISTDYTYGFRYSSSNSLNVPMFSILGYTAEDIPIFKNQSEMTIEILEGRLLFNDSANSRNVYVNFTHEPSTGRQTINVESVYEYNDIHPVKYLTGSDTYDTALYDGSIYSYFTERYESADSSCIIYNLLHDIDVNSAGSYHVAVTGYDEHNNIYTVPARGTSDIFTPDVSLTIYSNDISDSSADASILSDGYSEYCIYPETVMVKNLTVSRDDIYKTDTSTEIQYNSYSYALSVPDSSDYLHLMNIADEFEAAGITKKVSSFPAFSTDVMNSYSVALNRIHTKYINKFMDWNSGDEITAICQELQRDASTGKYDVDTFLETVSGHPEITNFDVNVIFYNKLGGYPELQTYGWMIGCAGLPEKYFTDAAQYKSADEFRLYLPDKSTTSFVWAETVSAARQDICVHISENALNSLPDTYDKEYCSGIIGDTVEYMLKAAEQVADNSVWKTILKNLYSSVSTTPQEFDNATYRYNGYSIETDGSTYNPYNILRYKYSKANEREALEILRKNMLSLGNTSEFLNEVKLFLSNDHNDASISALTFMDTYMEMFYTDDSLLEIAAGAAVLLSKNAEWGTDVSQKLVPYYKYIYDMFFKEGSLMYSAVGIINDGVPSGEEGSRIMVENSNRMLVIETGARETLQNSLNDIINKYIKANPEYKTLIRQTIYRDFYIQMVYTIYKYIFLLYFSYIISRGDLLQYPVYAATDHPAIIGNTQEIIDAALTDKTIDGVSVPDASNGVMAEFILARLGSDDTQKSVFYVPMYYNSDVEVYTPVEFDGDSSYGQQTQYRTASKEYDIDWDPDSMQFVVNWKEDASLDMNSYELNIHPYCNILACIPQYQENMAELFIATGKALYEYDRRCEYLGDATIDRYIRNEMLTDDKWLTIARNDSSYYAVISETGDYVKTGDNPLDGLSVGGSMLPIVPDIYQYLNNPEYSIYVQPIWKSAVQIGILNEFTENNAISTDVPLDDPNERYIYVEYLENSFSCRFNIGEIVRLTFYRTAPDNSQVFESACSYRVVGYDSTGQILVLKGYINESQFAEVYNPVYALLQNAALDPSVNEQIEAARVNQTINIINVPYDNEHGTGEYEMRIARLNPDNLQELYYTPVYYDSSAGEYRQMETSEMTVSGFQIYISYAHHTFVDYVMRPDGISSDDSNNISIAVQKKRRSGHCLQFIDDTFIMDIKDFDKTDAYRYWDTGITVDDNRLPSVCSQPIYEHTDIPVTAAKGQNIAIKSFIKNTDDAGQTEYKRYWKIYRSDSLSDSPEYKFTSFNETLYLTCADYGYYDIECFVYDKYGNTSQKYFKNAIIVK